MSDSRAILCMLILMRLKTELSPFDRLRLHKSALMLNVFSGRDCFDIEDETQEYSPFFGKNVQSMLKLGRAQGVAIAAAINHSVPITEYAPMKIKMAITGTGTASKEQVAGMLQRMLHLDQNDMPKFLDATDALAIALCHFYETSSPLKAAKGKGGWEQFVKDNPDRIF